MTAEPPLEIAPPPPPRTVQWRRARHALGRLIDDPERTEEVFALIDALAGGSGERLFQRFLRHENARPPLREKPSLLAALSDLDALEALPDCSFGRAYARFMREGELRAQGLVDASEAPEREAREAPTDPDREWFFDRLRDMHDLWHVLTGYGRDVAGEAANLAFTYGQIRNRGVGVIVLAAAVLGPKSLDLRWPRYLWRARRRGARIAPARGALRGAAAAFPRRGAPPARRLGAGRGAPGRHSRREPGRAGHGGALSLTTPTETSSVPVDGRRRSRGAGCQRKAAVAAARSRVEPTGWLHQEPAQKQVQQATLGRGVGRAAEMYQRQAWAGADGTQLAELEEGLVGIVLTLPCERNAPNAARSVSLASGPKTRTTAKSFEYLTATGAFLLLPLVTTTHPRRDPRRCRPRAIVRLAVWVGIVETLASMGMGGGA